MSDLYVQKLDQVETKFHQLIQLDSGWGDLIEILCSNSASWGLGTGSSNPEPRRRFDAWWSEFATRMTWQVECRDIDIEYMFVKLYLIWS